jgi:hypothetical protein
MSVKKNFYVKTSVKTLAENRKRVAVCIIFVLLLTLCVDKLRSPVGTNFTHKFYVLADPVTLSTKGNPPADLDRRKNAHIVGKRQTCDYCSYKGDSAFGWFVFTSYVGNGNLTKQPQSTIDAHDIF